MTKKANNKTNISNNKITSTVAKSDDGTIQITFTILNELITNQRKKAIEEYAKTIEIPGFRKGKVPVSKAEEHIDENKLTEKILNDILPKAFGDAIKKHKLKLKTLKKMI